MACWLLSWSDCARADNSCTIFSFGQSRMRWLPRCSPCLVMLSLTGPWVPLPTVTVNIYKTFCNAEKMSRVRTPHPGSHVYWQYFSKVRSLAQGAKWNIRLEITEINFNDTLDSSWEQGMKTSEILSGNMSAGSTDCFKNVLLLGWLLMKFCTV